MAKPKAKATRGSQKNKRGPTPVRAINSKPGGGKIKSKPQAKPTNQRKENRESSATKSDASLLPEKTNRAATSANLSNTGTGMTVQGNLADLTAPLDQQKPEDKYSSRQSEDFKRLDALISQQWKRLYQNETFIWKTNQLRFQMAPWIKV